MIRLAPVLILLAAALAAAESQTLVFKDGKKRTVTLLSFDDSGLKVRRGSEEVVVFWDDLTPTSAVKARKALTPYDDGAARLALAEFAAERSLFPEAQEELEIALALGGLDEPAFERRAHELEKAEVEYLTRRIDDFLKRDAEPEICLQAIKRLRERYPANAANAVYEPHIERLVEKLAGKVEAEKQKKQKAIDDRELGRLQKAVDVLVKRKEKALAKAAVLVEESKAAIEKRQVSRVKKKLVEPVGAEKYYKQARKYLRALARTDKHFRIVDKAVLQQEYDALEGKLIDAYLNVARSQLGQRNYKGTIPYVRKILYYDPIHEEALEMVEEIRNNRIAFKLSDITNARPRVTGG